MKRDLRALAVAATLLLWYCAGDLAFAQKQGGSLRVPHFDSPASMSLHEESTVAANRPLMGVFNNLVMFDQHVVQNSPRSIVPDLATSWSWNEEGTELTLLLRQGVRWHDGKPFTAKDVQCTWELLTGKSSEQLRINPRKGWYNNLDEVTANGDFEVTFHLKRAQPSFLSMLASGWSAVYPCHVPAREMRQHPIGTGPFKFVEFRPNQSITVTRNPDYWKQGLPYLDGIEWTIIKDLSTRTLAFVAGKGDLLYGVTIPQLKDIKSQAPAAICEVLPANVSRNLLVNRDKPPFDNPGVRRAMSLSLNRKAFIDILYAGQGDIGGAMQPPPAGLWGLPAEELQTLPGYTPDVEKNRAEAREIMQKLGYGADKRLPVTVSTRDVSYYRDPAVILIDQLKEIYMDGELAPVDTTNWYPKVTRKDYTVGMNITESEVDDPDVLYYENYACGAARNYTAYCNPDLDKLINQQSIGTDLGKRKQIVWQIERKLVEDDARPVIFFPRGAVCRQPSVKGLTLMVNSIYNGQRFEDLWLDK
jgi:peptide/nickel transport system substrate-binding protein